MEYKPHVFVLTVLVLFSTDTLAQSSTAPVISAESQACIDCHESFQPGIVADWRRSRHASISPDAALGIAAGERRMSAQTVPQPLRQAVVGCYECHALHPERHPDNFDHFGYAINVVVSPNDCSVCHPLEADQYSRGKKAHAVDNLKLNPVFSLLVNEAISVKQMKGNHLARLSPSGSAEHTTCFGCHGTRVTVQGMKTVVTDQGDVDVPVLANWPNQGVGRINPDTSVGACTACHSRHAFSIAVARKPFTCSQCHLQPDLPAWDVYAESKHGNLMLSEGEQYDWTSVPWRAGRDFRAPTCASCHNSMLTSGDGSVAAERSHDFGARLWTRIFGLPYAHPQPKGGATHVIRNADGQPLPATFDGKPAAPFLISREEQQQRRTAMRNVCRQCHSTDWADGHFARLDTTIAETNEMTLAATRILQSAWSTKLADPVHPFDEPLEQKWVEQWLFYANSTRYGAAMSGPDYSTFKNGWWDLTRNLREMQASTAGAKQRK